MSAREIDAKLNPHVLCLSAILDFGYSRVYKKHRFQIAPLWRAFLNGSVFGDRLRRCSVDYSRIRSKTAPFSFENGLVWTGPQSATVITAATSTHAPLVKMGKNFHNYRCNVFTCVFACSLNSDFVFQEITWLKRSDFSGIKAIE